MKNIVRLFVTVLVLTGVAASTHTSASAQSSVVTVSKTSAMPVPSCPPNDPDACGIVQKPAPHVVSSK